MATSKHLVEIKGAVHRSVKSLEGGACLNGGCATTYKKKESCSYRWQGVSAYRDGLHGGARPNKYVTPVLAGPVPTSRYEIARSIEQKLKQKIFNPGKYPSLLPKPGPGDWDIDGPTKGDRVIKDPGTGRPLYTIKKGKNFEGLIWPWWNNAHHLIPKATLRNAIEEVEDPDDWDGLVAVRTIIKRFLLHRKYNVNHYRNVILLPMDKEVGKRLGLPRHLVIDESTKPAAKRTGDKHPKTNHEKYGRVVRIDLAEVIKEFKKTAANVKNGKPCASAEMDGSPEKLEELSQKCHDALINLGELSPGEPISSLQSLDIPQA